MADKNYSVSINPVKLDSGEIVYFAKCEELKGCVAQGDTPVKAMKALEENIDFWIETAKEAGIPIPTPKMLTKSEFSGKFTVRLEKSTHEALARAAKLENVSINQFVNTAIVEKLASHKQRAQDWWSNSITILNIKNQCKAG